MPRPYVRCPLFQLRSQAPPVLAVVQEVVRSEKFRRTLATVLKTWRSPQILADYYNIQQKERKARSR